MEWDIRTIGVIVGLAFTLIAIGFGVNHYIDREVRRVIDSHFQKQLSELRTLETKIKTDSQALFEIKTSLESTRQLAFERAVALTIIILEAVPPLSFAQQIPERILRNIGFVVKKSVGPDPGADVPMQELRAWLWYATAIQRLAMQPNDRTELEQVLALLHQAERVSANDESLQKNVVLRRIQALRQLNRFPEARSVSDDLASRDLNVSDADLSDHVLLGNLSFVIATIQEVLSPGSIDKERKLQIALDRIRPIFGRLYGWRCLGHRKVERDQGDTPQHDGSVAFYTAKLLWIMNQTPAPSAALREMCWEALDVAFDKYERIRQGLNDVAIGAVYNGCVSLLIVMRLQSGFCSFNTLRRLEAHHPLLGNREGWKKHLLHCTQRARVLAQKCLHLRLPNEAPVPGNLYSESTERIESVAHFFDDIEAIEAFESDYTRFSRRFLPKDSL